MENGQTEVCRFQCFKERSPFFGGSVQLAPAFRLGRTPRPMGHNTHIYRKKRAKLEKNM